jgi:hypothetical protein
VEEHQVEVVTVAAERDALLSSTTQPRPQLEEAPLDSKGQNDCVDQPSTRHISA